MRPDIGSRNFGATRGVACSGADTLHSGLESEVHSLAAIVHEFGTQCAYVHSETNAGPFPVPKRCEAEDLTEGIH